MITWDSRPDHDGWGYDSWWSAQDWIEWHKALVAHYGKDEADRLWSNEYDRSSWGAAEINFSTKNEAFRQYVQDQGLADKSGILSKVFRAEGSINTVLDPFADLYTGAGDVISGAGNALSGAGNALSGAGSFGSSLSKTLKWVPVIAVAVLIGVAVYYATRLAPAKR